MVWELCQEIPEGSTHWGTWGRTDGAGVGVREGSPCKSLKSGLVKNNRKVNPVTPVPQMPAGGEIGLPIA